MVVVLVVVFVVTARRLENRTMLNLPLNMVVELLAVEVVVDVEVLLVEVLVDVEVVCGRSWKVKLPLTEGDGLHAIQSLTSEASYPSSHLTIGACPLGVSKRWPFAIR